MENVFGTINRVLGDIDMAVIEVAKIQVRRGQKNLTAEPTLDSGEFGWAVDTQELWIGNGTLAEGAPQVGKTKILTEHDLTSNIFDLSTGTTYSYLVNDAGTHRDPNIANTISISNPSRSISKKLNDFVTIYDFAGQNDGSDNTLALQNAIDQLWKNSDHNDPRSRVALRIPAGTYHVSDTLYLPPYATLIGDGQEKTTIRQTTNDRALIQTWVPDRALGSSGQGWMLFQEGGTSAPGDNTVNINLIGITFEYDPEFTNGIAIISTLPLLVIDCALDSKIIDCGFKGYYAVGNFDNNIFVGDRTKFSAISIRGSAYHTKDLLIANCTFDGFYQAITSDYDIQDVTIQNSVFRNLSRGIVWAESPGIENNIGPARTKIQNNNFYNIEQEAIYFFQTGSLTPTYNISLNNTFKEVGNLIRGDGNPATPVVNFRSYGNRSVSDHFDRFDVSNNASSYDTYGEIIQGTVDIADTAIITKTLTSGDVTIAKFPISKYAPFGTTLASQSIKVPYLIRQGTSGASVVRHGEISLNVSTVDLDSTVSISDKYSYTGADNGMIEFSATTNTLTNTINLIYSNAGSIVGTISYNYSQIQ
jgi:hypothetical protein